MDFQPHLMDTCGGKLYVFYHSACEGKGVYMKFYDGFSWSDYLKVSSTHGSESNFYCWGDTLILMYYGWGDSVIYRATSYDGGLTWINEVFADRPLYKEDEPYVYKIGDTVYYTYIYEIEGSKIRVKREYPSGLDSLILNFSLPFALHNGKLIHLDTLRFISATGWNGNGVFLIKIHPGGYEILELIDTSYYSADIEVFGDSVFVLGSEPGFVRLCYSYNRGETFLCGDVAAVSGIVSNVELVLTPHGKFAIWSDSLTKFSIKIYRSLDNENWQPYDSIYSSGNEKFPVAIWNNGLNILWSSDRNGKYEVYFAILGINGVDEKIGCVDEGRFYNVLGRRVDENYRGIVFEVKCKSVKKHIRR